MSRIGKKVIITVMITLILSFYLISTVTVKLAKGHSHDLMAMHTENGVNVLTHDLNAQVNRLGDIYDALVISGAVDAAASGDISLVIAQWDAHKETESDFSAFADASGNIVWKTDNYNITDFDAARAMAGTYSGIINDSAAGLTIQYCAPVEKDGQKVGSMVMGMYLTECSWLEEVKEQQGAKVTIFQGDTRIATTVVNDDGSRAVGTQMAENVAEAVLTNEEVYNGQADILGHNHFVCYQPLYDINGVLAGAYFAGYPSSESDALFNRISIISSVCTIGAEIICAIVMFVLIRKLIEKPIIEAEKVAENMRNGKLSVPDSDFPFARDEIGDFVRNLEETKHSLNSYIRDITRVISSMANGDFTAKPQVAYYGDFTEIEDSFEQIELTLSEVISNMNMSANDVMSGSAQIAGGSQMLADGTTKQASAIQELSAAIHEISGQVRQSAKNAEEASRLSHESAEKIKAQNGEMSHMLSAMEEIKDKSNQIRKIISAIDDIAFQTNILALNAAVEAARAGAAGKGFAVVADEVRNLAAKSAESAKNTGILINATVEAVDNGAAIAQNTAAIMEEVMDISERTNVIIDEISDAANQQAQSIRQINSGIDQISSVVQQNSATAEETAASCEELSSQSKILREQVDKLRA